MSKSVRTALVCAALAALIVPGVAQVEEKAGTQEAKQVVWVMTYSGGGGWGAAATANKVRAALKKIESIEQVEVDSTARAWIKTKGDQKPDKEALEKAMARHKVKSLERVERVAPAAVYVVTLKGMSWGNSCYEAREALSNLPDVQAVLPFGDTHKVKILTSKAAGITKEAVVKELGDSKLKLKDFTHKKLKKAKKGD